MKKVIQHFNFLLMFTLCFIFISCRTSNTAVSAGRSASIKIDLKQEVIAPVPIEGIPIIASIGVNEHTLARYLELKECGFDHNFSGHINIETLTQSMDFANAAKVRMIILILGHENEPEILANHFKDHPALAGYFLSDEPNRIYFPHLGELARKVKAIDNEHFCYINLFPNYASPEQLGTSTYREYVQLFLKEVPVPILPFDHYPIRVNASGVRFLVGIWYENLEIIADEARKAEIPFWAHALSTAHGPYPLPTLADLRLQVYSNLAYGAQGIQYYTYWTQPFDAEGLGYNNGPIEYNTGQRTPTWYTVQQMNREIKALSNVFLSAQVIKVEHIATNASGENGDIPTGTTRFIFANRPAEAKKIIKNFTIPNNTNALVSFLKNGNRAYMVIVNKNLEGGDNVTFTISGGAGLQLIKKDGKAVSAFFQSRKQTITPGDVLIYGWDIK